MISKRKTKKDFVHIGSILPKALGKYRRQADSEVARVWDLWNYLLDGEIVENARPAAFKGRTLIVYVTSSSWIHQLQFIKSQMISDINRGLGRDLIEEIKFKIGPI